MTNRAFDDGQRVKVKGREAPPKMRGKTGTVRAVAGPTSWSWTTRTSRSRPTSVSPQVNSYLSNSYNGGTNE